MLTRSSDWIFNPMYWYKVLFPLMYQRYVASNEIKYCSPLYIRGTLKIEKNWSSRAAAPLVP